LTPPDVRVASFAELTPAILYGIVRLRQDIFVLEQACAYRDMDGRDAEPDTRHLWIERDGAVVSSLRLLHDSDGAYRIGRVVTDAAHRRRGFARVLVEHAIALAGPPLVLSAQEHLAPWYERFGFVVCGDRWVEDGIAHVPMRLDAVLG
jgi:ElaA protein